MSLIDLASLVLAPTAVKDGKVYNAIPNDQDFTFSRGTEATRVNSAGLIEKARTNFLLQSNTFDTTWTSINTIETGGQTGYDGSSNAWLITKSASAARVQQSISVSGVQTLSVYAKAGTLNYIAVSNNISYVYFDISNGTIGTEYNNIDSSITSVGNGWYRCSITYNGSATDARFYPSQGDNDSTGTSGNILIQNAQLEQGLVSTDVITTTTSSVTVGITDDLPRVDYSGGGCPSLLLEPSRTNLITQSEYFEGHTLINVTATANDAISPEGVTNAYKITESNSSGEQTGYLEASCTSGNDYTLSIFAKANTRNWFFLRFGGANGVFANSYAWFNLSDGTTGTIQSGITASIEDYGNGWYRLIITRSAIATATGRFFWGLADANGSTSYTGNGNSNLYVYGFQAEAGSYVSSYIPTYGTSTSRSADSCSLTNASNLIGQSEGTMFWDLETTNTDLYKRLSLNDGSTTNWIFVGIELATGVCRGYVKDSGVVQVSVTGTTDLTGDRIKLALAYANNDFALYANGSQVATDTSGTIPSCSRIDVGSQNPASAVNSQSTTNQAILFPTRLTNDQLEELTK